MEVEIIAALKGARKPSILKLNTSLYETTWFSKIDLKWYIYQRYITLGIDN